MKIMYIFPHSMQDTYRNILSGKSPTDRMYGLIELQKMGYEVEFSDSRFQGSFSRIRSRIKKKYGLSLLDLKSLMLMKSCDVIIVKDNFSTIISIASRLFKKKIIYIDALFGLPKNMLAKAIVKINLKLCDGVVVYSDTQKKQWSYAFNIDSNIFKELPYTIDIPFYKKSIDNQTISKPYILSIGRDLGRDFKTLVEAMEGLDLDLKIVTLPYLLKDINVNRSWIEVLQNVSYNNLFQLYSGALLIAIPLKKNIFYPSGIRGMIEAIALEKCVVATSSPILEEYAVEGQGVVYVEAENVEKLRNKIKSLIKDTDYRILLEKKGKELIKKYDINLFSRSLASYLSSL